MSKETKSDATSCDANAELRSNYGLHGQTTALNATGNTTAVEIYSHPESSGEKKQGKPSKTIFTFLHNTSCKGAFTSHDVTTTNQQTNQHETMEHQIEVTKEAAWALIGNDEKTWHAFATNEDYEVTTYIAKGVRIEAVCCFHSAVTQYFIQDINA